VFLFVIAASRGEPRWRVQLYLVMWTITRPLAFFVGLAWHGWLGGIALFGIVFVLETIALRAHGRV
jgi:hypothetical protein